MDQMVQITMNRWNEAKGPIWTTYPNRYRDRPICRYIGLRPSTGPDGPSIRHGPQGSDIGNFHPSNPISETDHIGSFGPDMVQEKKCGGGRPGRFRTKWTKSILRGNGWSSMRPSDIGDDSGPAIGSISSRSRRWRRIDSGNNLHLSAAALFACHAPERIRNIPGKR